MDDTSLRLITLCVPPLLLLGITKVSIWRGNRKFLRENPGQALPRVPGCVNTGCLFGPALILFLMLLDGMLQGAGR